MGRFFDQSRLGLSSSEGVEEQVGEETVEFDQDAGRDAKPNGGEHRSGGQEFFHDGKPKRFREAFGAWHQARRPGLDLNSGQRGEIVTLLSTSVSLPLVSSPKAARGQVAAARVLLKARGRSIWISFIVASLSPRTAWR